jgi:hypothetical protein
MGAALPIAAVAMSAIAPIVQGIGENSEARAAARADDENGRLSILSGERDVEQVMRDERDAAGEALAIGAGSGLLVGTGSLADIIAASARERDRDIGVRRRQALGEQRNYQQAAKDKRKAGKNAIISGAFNGVANALAGANGMSNAGKRSAASANAAKYS